jgi:hypothetical protein
LRLLSYKGGRKRRLMVVTILEAPAAIPIVFAILRWSHAI